MSVLIFLLQSDKQNVPPPRQMTVGKGRAEAYNELRPTSDDTFRKTPGIHIELNQGKEVDGETNLKLPLAGGNEIVGREEHGPLNVAPEVWITQPLNDSVISVGDVVVAFKTRGFRPSVETPVEVSSTQQLCREQQHASSMSELSPHSDERQFQDLRDMRHVKRDMRTVVDCF